MRDTPRCTIRSNTAATAGMSTSTTFPRCPGGCDRSRGFAPRITFRHFVRAAARLTAGTSQCLLRRPRSCPSPGPHHRAAAGACPRLRLQSVERLLVPRRRRHAAPRDRRGAQHLRRTPRLPVATRRPAGGDGQDVLRLPVQSGGAATTWCKRRDPTARSISPWRCTATVSRPLSRICAASGDRQPPEKSRSCKSSRRWHRCWWPCASEYRGSSCGYVEFRWCRDDSG